MRIVRDRAARSITLSQPGYIKPILEDPYMSDCNPALTPMDEHIKPSVSIYVTKKPGGETWHEGHSLSIIASQSGSYYTWRSPRGRISLMQSVYSVDLWSPEQDHWDAAKRVLCHLKGTVDMSLVYSHSFSPDLFTTFSDADLQWAVTRLIVD